MTRTYTFNYASYDNPPVPVVEAHIFSPDNPELVETVFMIVDTGADAAILPKDIIKKLDVPLIGTATMRGIHGIGTTTAIHHVSIRIGDYTINRVEAASQKNLKQPILGRDVLNYLVMTLDGPAEVILIM